MMRVGYGDRERIGGIGPGDLRSRKQPRDHGVDLRLLGIADADDRFLDQPRGIFADVDTGARRRHDDDAARLAELQRRLRVGVDEHFLDCCGTGTVVDEERFKLASEVSQASWQRCSRAGLDLPVADVTQAIALGLDQSPAGRAEPGIEAEDNQPSFSSSSSGTS